MPARRLLPPALCLAFAAPATATTTLFLEPDAASRLTARDLDPAALVADVTGDASPEIAVRAGNRVHVLTSRATWPSGLDLDATPGDFVVRGLDRTPRIVGAGDVNGDGRDDLLLADWRAGIAHAHLIFGAPAWPAERDLAAAPADVTLRNGILPHLADVNGDGIADLAWFRTATELRVRFGGASWPAAIDAADAADVTITGVPAAATGWGDVTGDGIPDLLYERSDRVLRIAGAAPWPAAIDAAAVETAVSGATDGVFAFRVADVIGDAAADLVLDEGLSDDTRVNRGGGADGVAETILAWCDAAQEPRLVTPADVDGDGRPDLLLAAATQGPRGRGPASGMVAAWTSRPTGALDACVRSPDLVIHGAARPIVSIASGDLDGDGRTDLLAGDAGALRILLAPGAAAPDVPPADRFVDPVGGDDALEGLSWATARRTLGPALDELDELPGVATVRVAAGTLHEAVRLGHATRLVGSYGPAGVRDPTATPTIVDAGGTDVAVRIGAGHSPEPALLDGFVVTGGRSHDGGGIVIAGDARVANCIVTGNEAELEIVERQCPLPDASGRYESYCAWLGQPAAGIHADDWEAHVELDDVLVFGNGARTLPEPPGCRTFEPSCEHPAITGLEGLAHGIFLRVRSSALSHVTVTGHSGRGIWFELGFLLTGQSALRHVVAWGNAVDDVGGTLLTCEGYVVPHESFLGTTSEDMGPGANAGRDPLFVDAASGNFRLSAVDAGQAVASPAVDAGGTSHCSSPDACLADLTTRTDGRPDDGWMDAGFHFFGSAPPAFDGLASARASSDCGVDLAWSPAAAFAWDGACRYEIARFAPGDAPDFSAPLASLPAGTLSWHDAAVPAGVEVRYAVRAVTVQGASAGGARSVGVIVSDGVPPIAGLALAGSSGCEVTLSVAASDACSGVARVELHRGASPDFVPSAATIVAIDPPASAPDVVPSNGWWTYALRVEDAAGNVTWSPRVIVRVATCTGPEPAPGAASLRLARSGALVRLAIGRADGAEFHRAYVGTIAALRAGTYDHVASSSTGTGACRIDGGGIDLPLAGGAYVLVAGVNAAGEGPVGFDSAFRRLPGMEDAGRLDCP